MATKESGEDIRLEHQQLLLLLKSTVEGLLAFQSSNVWSTYGGLSRLCNDVESILKHGLKQQQALYSNGSEYWTFIKGLRWLKPTLAPLIEQAGKESANDGIDRGKAWVRQSLQNHNLSSQLKILVESKDHLHQCYHAYAFLCSEPHYEAVHVCLKAVEENNPALLASIDPKLLKQRKISHMRSSSLPINQPSGQYAHSSMSRKRDSLPTSEAGLEPPPFPSPKTESILTTSDDHAIASNVPSSPRERFERRNSAKNILLSVLEGTDYRTYNECENGYTAVASDPLMNTQFHLDNNYASNEMHGAQESKKNRSYENGSLNAAANSEKRTSRLPDSVGAAGKSKAVRRQRSSLNESDLKRLMEEEEDEDDSSEYLMRTMKVRSRTTVNDKLLFANDSSEENEEEKRQQEEKQKEKERKKNGRPLSQHMRSKSDVGFIHNVKVQEIPAEGSHSQTDVVDSANLSSSLPAKIERTSYLEEDMSSTECMFPKPVEGQSLMSFLSSQDFQTWPDLDRENAHFSISEAIISAIEQIKCNQYATKSDDESDASDEEIQELKQRIRIRRRERRKEKAMLVSPAFSDGRTDTTTTSSVSPSSSPALSGSDISGDSGSSDLIEELELTDNTQSGNLTELSSQGLTASLASLYSDADIRRQSSHVENSLVESSNSTADAVAICLLKKFSAKQLPAASDLDWLVSEQDVPQALLPLPKSFPISPDDGENSDLVLPNKNIRVRGNLEWAPPRPQIIFNIHPAPRRKVIVAKQNYRCAGCGMKIEPGYLKRLRYCEYLGKFFCHCCHANSLSPIPARILRKWDFRKYAVSNFSRDLIIKMQNDPFFNVTDVNPLLYRKVKSLDVVRELRTQLYFLKDFIRTCRQGQSMWNEFDKRPHHLIHDTNIYSLNDLIKVRNGDMAIELKELVEDAIIHVKQCQLCQAKGFICELCNNSEIIFPFDLGKCVQCQACWACYHRNCFVPEKCPKCERIRVRHLRMQKVKSEEEMEETNDKT
ncbi:run domain Beclin-1-interacting and cysteine-rich domain-containing protein-like [Ptychodera flava]|uniref:run domain Beclin-1-interacting and cysteine-rich domain-containing protein-like n=1 Tax=Ptychodera flava TaxID=63121 RepID=UPI00396A460F